MRLRNAFEHTARRFRFLFELGEQTVDHLHNCSLYRVAASAALRTRACNALHPEAMRDRCSSGNGPTSVWVNVISVQSAVSLKRQSRFEVAAGDMTSGPQITRSVGRLMLCTNLQMWPLSPPRSRYQ